MTRQELRDKEQNELQRLINDGFDFTCEYDIIVRRGLFGKRVEHRVEAYHIAEPTLGTLDRISAESIKIDIDADEYANADVVTKARHIATKNARQMSRIIAIAVLGNKISMLSEKCPYNAKKRNEKQIDELSEIFMHCIKPSDLVVITDAIMSISNLLDFWKSTMLISLRRTSKPNIVEGSSKA